MSDHPDFIPDDEFYDGPSRSMLKREAEAQKDSVDDLLKLSKSQLKKFTFFDAEFLDALALMQRMPFGPHYRRQRNYLGKRIRQAEWHDAIQHTLSIVLGDSKQAIAMHHRCEQWRDRMLEKGDDALTAFINEYPDADRQAFRQTIRLAVQEKEQEKPPKHARQLFKMIRTLLEPQLAAVLKHDDDDVNEDDDQD